MKSTTILGLVIAIALGLYILVPELAWQADTHVTRAQQMTLPRSQR
jgi:hypothetical protein